MCANFLGAEGGERRADTLAEHVTRNRLCDLVVVRVRFRVARRLPPTRVVAEESADVIQTTWLELLRRLHEIRSPQALTSWLVTTTRREAWRVRELSRRQAPDGAAAPSWDARRAPNYSFE